MRRLLTVLALLTAAVGAHAQCLGLAEQLPERLAAAKNEIGDVGTVRLHLVVDKHGLQRIESIEGPRRA